MKKGRLRVKVPGAQTFSVSQFVISYLFVGFKTRMLSWFFRHVQICRNAHHLPALCRILVASPLNPLSFFGAQPIMAPRIYPSGTLFRLLRLARTTSSDLEPQAMGAWHWASCIFIMPGMGT